MAPSNGNDVPNSTINHAKLTPTQNAFFLLLLTIAMVIAAWYAKPGLNWLLVFALMATFFAVIGTAITNRPLGFLINESHIMSLSRFQTVLWTLIVISGYFVIVISRIKWGDVANPLAVQIDPKIWTLLGISAASLVGSPLITSTKKQRIPDNKVFDTAGRPYGDDPDKVKEQNVGVLYPNRNVTEARLTDMFEGEELANAALVDLPKVQMFFFTIVVALAYCGELLHSIAVDDLTVDNMSLPTISDGLLALMGISNAGYLGGKSVTQTPSSRKIPTGT